MRHAITKDKLTEKLAEFKKIPSEKLHQLTQEARKSKKSLFLLMIQQSLVADDEMMEFLSDNLAIPILNMPSLRIEKETIKLVPRKIVEKYLRSMLKDPILIQHMSNYFQNKHRR